MVLGVGWVARTCSKRRKHLRSKPAKTVTIIVVKSMQPSSLANFSSLASTKATH